MKPLIRSRALIVDDEVAARNDLRELLTDHPGIEIVGEAKSAADALDQFRENKPDLIFLDVRMPRRDGFSLLPELRPVPDIVFVTAYDCFAVRAFEVNAVDYLVKPIAPERLAHALARIRKKEKRRLTRFDEQDFIILYSDMQVCVVLPHEITHIEAEQNYSHVHIANRNSILVRRKMGEWMKILPPSLFCRPYRSLIVNRRAVKELVPLPRKHAALTFAGNEGPIQLGRGPARRLRHALREMTENPPKGQLRH
jgi:Response regulator of the LytR/AlgR family